MVQFGSAPSLNTNSGAGGDMTTSKNLTESVDIAAIDPRSGLVSLRPTYTVTKAGRGLSYVVDRFLDQLQSVDPRFTQADVMAALYRDGYFVRIHRFLTSHTLPTALYCGVNFADSTSSAAKTPSPTSHDDGDAAAAQHQDDDDDYNALPMVDLIRFTASLATTHMTSSRVIFALKVPTSGLLPEQPHQSTTSDSSLIDSPVVVDLSSEVLFGSVDREHPIDEFLALTNEVLMPLTETIHAAHMSNPDIAPTGYTSSYRRADTEKTFRDSMKAMSESITVITRLHEKTGVTKRVVSLEEAGDVLKNITCSPTGYVRASKDHSVSATVQELFAEWLYLLRGKDAKEKCSGFYIASEKRNTNNNQQKTATASANNTIHTNHSSIGPAIPSASIRRDSAAMKSEDGNGGEDGNGFRIDFQMVPEGFGPKQEEEAWLAYEIDIRNELEALASPEVASLLRVLELCNGTLYREFLDCVASLRATASVATNVLRHLPSLSKAAVPLREESPLQAAHSVADLVSAVDRLVSVVPYYQSKEHLTLLCLSISNQVITCAKRSIRQGGRVWDQADKVPMLETMLSHFDATINLSRLFKEAVVARASLSDLDELIIFGKLELFCTRLIKLKELFNCVHTYRVLELHSLDDLESLLNTFFGAFDDLRRKSGDCLDYTKPAFDRDFFTFRRKIAEMDRSLQVYVNSSFEKITTTLPSLHLLKKFEALMQRDSIKADLQAKYLIMFQRYGADVETVQRVYEQAKVDPPATRNAPPVASRVMWARHLLRRIEEPMGMFQKCHSMVSHQRDTAKIIRLYNRVALTLTKYEAFWIDAWHQAAAHAATGLHATVLVRDRPMSMAASSSHNNNIRSQLGDESDAEPAASLIVNLDHHINEAVREARFMTMLGVPVPQEAQALLHHRLLPTYAAQLQFLVRWAHQIMEAIDPLHTQALEHIVTDLEVNLFDAGLNNITWASPSLGHYLSLVAAKLESHERLVNRVNGIVECRINPAVAQVANTSVLVDVPAMLAPAFTPGDKPSDTVAEVAGRVTARRAILGEDAGTDKNAQGGGNTSSPSSSSSVPRLISSDYLQLQQQHAISVAAMFATVNDAVRQAAVDLCQLISPKWVPSSPPDDASSNTGGGSSDGSSRSFALGGFAPFPGENNPEAQERAREEAQQDALTRLYTHYNRQLFRAALSSLTTTLANLNAMVGTKVDFKSHVGSSSRNANNSTAATSSAIDATLEIVGSHVLLTPSRDDLQGFVNDVVTTVLDTSKSIGEWPHIRGAYCTSESAPFFEEVSKNKSIVKCILHLTGGVFGVRKQLSDYLLSFQRFSVLWHNDPAAVVSSFTQGGTVHRPLSQFEEELAYCGELLGRIRIIPDDSAVGCLLVDARRFKYRLLDIVGRWRHCYGNALQASLEARLALLQDTADGIYKKVTLAVTDDYRTLTREMECLEAARVKGLESEDSLAQIAQGATLLDQYNTGRPHELRDRVHDLQSRWGKIHTYASDKQHQLNRIQPNYKRELASGLLQFGVDIICFRNNFEANGPLVEGTLADDGVERLKKFQRLLDDRMRKWQSNLDTEEIFSYPVHCYPQLSLTVKEMHAANRLYKLYSDVTSKVSQYRQVLWVELHYSKVVEELSELQGGLKKLPAAMKRFDAYREGKRLVDLYLDLEQVVEQLSHRSIKPRHWKEVMQICGNTWSTDRQEFRLKHVVDANLLPHKDDILELAMGSEKEGDIEMRLNKVASEWKEYELSFSAYKQRGMVTLKADDTAMLRESLEEGMVVLGSLLASKYIAPFRQEAHSWMTRLTAIGESLSLLLEVQALWIYLEAVFAGGDIMKQLPQEAKRFAMVDRQWVKLFFKAAEIRSVLDFCFQNDALKGLPHLKDQLEICQRALSVYLENKRNIFARFYFVSDAILLEVLSQGSDANAIQPHLQSIFDGIHRVGIQPTEDRKVPKIVSFHSAEGEMVQMTEPVFCNGNVESWLERLCEESQRTLRVILREAVGEVSNTRSDQEYFKHFIYKYPSQVVLTALQIRYTADVQATLDAGGGLSEEVSTSSLLPGSKGGGATAQRHRRELSKSLVQIKEWLAEQARQGSLTEAKKTHIETLTTLAVHNLEVWEQSVKKAKNSEAFDWLKQLRFFFNDATGCSLQIADASMAYCNEYLGIKERLVITPLTDRCYVTLSQALAMFMGGAPAGPAGTGKTETVKDLGRAAGKYVVVFNCSDQWDVRALGKIFKGLAQSGSWGCFDEFNRITLPVLSVVSQQLNTIFHGLRQREENFTFTNGQLCPLRDTVGIFVTMNPGYAGRQELPENLKALFRGVSMMVPDRQVIMKTKLAACGYKTDATLSRKFHMLYGMCEQQLSGQRHYDFGLRNILSVLRSAGDLLRRASAAAAAEAERLGAVSGGLTGARNSRSRTASPSRGGAADGKARSSPSAADTAGDEEVVFLRCVRDINISKLVRDDVPVFLSLLDDIFPGKSANSAAAGNAALQEAMVQVCKDTQKAPSEGFLHKCTQIYDTKVVRHGIMVVGPAMGGKTTALNTLLAALTEVERRHREVRMNPKAITAGQMFGEMDPVTGDWTDGIFSYLWRRTNKETSYTVWLVCDGPVDTLWIESLNTVLDDNKLLTLANGDRIQMSPTLKMCFEVENLANASPATVSRAGIIYVSLEDVGWYPLFFSEISKLVSERKWSSTVANTVLELGKLHLENLFKDVVQGARSYLGISLQHYIATFIQIIQPILEAACLVFKNPKGSAAYDDDGGRGTESVRQAPRRAFRRASISAAVAEEHGLRVDDDDDAAPKQSLNKQETLVHMAFWYAASWSIAGSLDATDRDKFVSNIMPCVPRIHADFPDGDMNIFDVYINPTEGRWESWASHVPAFLTTWDPSHLYVDTNRIFVPTLESVTMHHILLNHFEQGRPALLLGREGAAKTITVEKFLSSNSHDGDSKTWAKINISRATVPSMLQSAIDEHCEKRIGSIYGPKRNRQLALFLDDLNMSEANEWGDQITCELLRQVIEWNGLFSIQRVGEWRRYVDIRYFGALSVSSAGGGSGAVAVGGGGGVVSPMGVPMRLLRHFAVYAMPFPQDTTLEHVYGSILGGRFGSTSMLASIVPSIVEATLSLWRSCHTHLKPTPTRFHYSFNLRDLSRITQGMLMAAPHSIESQTALIRLWQHECTRVLCDKLSLSEDVAFFNDAMSECGRRFFGTDDLASEGPPAANFCREIKIDPVTGEEIDEPMCYELVDKDMAGKRIEEALLAYNEQRRVVKVDIVLFDFAMRHLLRIARILSTPRGSALLVGVGGSGKQSLTRVAAYTQRQHAYFPTITAAYTTVNWLDDLRGQCLFAGIQGPCTFVITDAHIKDESYLEYINAALSSGDVPGLFSADERENARNAIRHIAKQVARRQFEDSEEWLWNFFLGRVRDNLHFVLCFSPQGAAFRRRVRQFPGLIASCTVNYFFPWPSAALSDVATYELERINLETTDAVRKALPKLFGDIHTRCGLVGESYFTQYRQRVYTTPEVYLTFLKTFVKVYTSKRDYYKVGHEALTGGLRKLQEAADDVTSMRVALAEKETALREAQRETEILLVENEKQAARAEKQADEVQRVTDILLQEADRITAIREDAERDLMAAQPAVEAARAALNQITPTDIKTLKAMQRPPEMIRRIFDGVCILMHGGVDKPAEWEMHKLKLRMVDSWKNYGRAMCSRNDLLEKLNEFNGKGKDEVNDETCELLLPYLWQEDFTYARALKASGNIAGLCTWVRAMKEYRDISKFVAPKIDALNAAEHKMRIANAKLEKQKEALAKAQAELQECMERLNEAKARRDQLEEDANSTRRRVTYATALIDALGDEKVRWKQQAQTFEATIERLVGDVCSAAAFITYAAPYNTDYRTKLIREAVQTPVAGSRIPFSTDFSFIRFMVDEQAISGWQLEGLPMDDHSVENAIIVTNSLQFPLMIDPQTQASKWIKNHLDGILASNHIDPHSPIPTLSVSTPSENGFLKKAETQLADGMPLVLTDTNFEKRNPLLYALIERRQVKLAGRGSTITVLGEPFDFNPKFWMYMTTKNPTFNYEPEVFAKVAVIDFSVTLRGLEQQLLAKVIQSERAELEQQKVQLAKDIHAGEMRLKHLEDELLEKLSSSQGSLVDDETLILTLQHSKSSAGDIKDSLVVAQETRKRISTARMEYSSVSMRAAVLYFVAVEMAAVNACYRLSLERFYEIFDRSMKESATSNSTNIRIHNINEHTTFNFFIYVGRGLFEAHKLMFSLLIALKIQIQDGKVPVEQFRLYTKGGTTIEMTGPNAASSYGGRQPPANPHPGWIPMVAWKNILAMTDVPKFKFFPEVFSRHAAEFKTFIEHEAPETIVSGIPGYPDLTPFEWLFAVRSLREDRALVAARKYISDVVGPAVVDVPTYDLDGVVQEVQDQRVPILVLLSAGSDPTSLIEAHAKRGKHQFHQISLGQGQEAVAMKLLQQCREKGDWVLFQNCHLGLPFLEQLHGWCSRETHMDEDHADLRVFVSSDPVPEFPTSLLLKCLKLTNEPPEGMAPAMNKVASWVSADSYDMFRRPEWRPLIFNLCFLHATLLERRKYGARGWTGRYEFGEGDFQASLTYLQNHIAALGDDSRHRANHTLPIQWGGVRYMVGDIHYGGRVTITNDRLVLATTTSLLLQPSNLVPGTYLCEKLERFAVPLPEEVADVTKFRQYISESFTAHEPPQAVGLFANAETQHRTREATLVLKTMLSVQPRSTTTTGGSTKEAVVLELLLSSLNKMPAQFSPIYLHEAAQRLDPVKPLTVFFVLEARQINKVVERVTSTMQDLKMALSGALGLSTALSSVLDALYASLVPVTFQEISWRSASFASWFTQLQRRHTQVLSHLENGFCNCYAISLLFNPQGFVNSIRQDVCRRHVAQRWVLDRVEPKFSITKITSPDDVEAPPAEGAYISGMLLDGAGWDVQKGRLRPPLPKEALREMPVILVSAQLSSGGAAVLAGNGGGAAAAKKDVTADIMAQLMAGNTNISPDLFRLARQQRSQESNVSKVRIPCFTHPSRGDAAFVCDVDLPHGEEDDRLWVVRGVALLCFGES